jgi:hypothetical protein
MILGGKYGFIFLKKKLIPSQSLNNSKLKQKNRVESI